MDELKPCPYSKPQISHAVDRMTLATINNEPSYLWPVDCYVALWALKNIIRATPENKPLTITLPCNIGDTVYEIANGLPIIAYHVTGFVLGRTEFEDEDDIEERQGWQIEYGKPGIDCECPISEFGKSLFLSHYDAEQALNARKPEGSEP